MTVAPFLTATTLRDGEQSPGCSMNLKEKIEVAKCLERLKVDVIEAGFAISSPGDFESVKTIAETVLDLTPSPPSPARHRRTLTAHGKPSKMLPTRASTFSSPRRRSTWSTKLKMNARTGAGAHGRNGQVRQAVHQQH